jgi:hypothetical protein
LNRRVRLPGTTWSSWHARSRQKARATPWIGAYAIAAHGYNRFSEDLDLLVDPSPDNTGRWVRALTKLPDWAAAELEGDDEIFEREGHYAIRINDEITVDIMPAACGHRCDKQLQPGSAHCLR